MSHLSKLPEREKDPGAALSLGEVFRAKEYLDEIKSVLKKGYSFDNIAAIFTEKCGVNISARQTPPPGRPPSLLQPWVHRLTFHC
jgi:hypothetical protein